MIRILKEAETNRGEIFAREDPVDSVEDPVRAILAQVKARGDEALKEYTKAFDGVELTSLEVGPGAVDEGFRSADPLLVEILYRAAERIAAFWSMRRTASSWGRRSSPWRGWGSTSPAAPPPIPPAC